MRKNCDSQVRQSRAVFHSVFSEMLINWEVGQIELMRQLHETTMAHLAEVGVLERKNGSTIICFTERLRRALADKMLDFVFPVDGDDADIPEDWKKVTPEIVEVKLKRNENPGYSLRFILGAYQLIQKKIESSQRVLDDLNEDYAPDSPHRVKEVKVTELVCDMIFMDNGLFLIPKVAVLGETGSWQARWSPEEIQEFRVLIQV